jgi:hypothetical protein
MINKKLIQDNAPSNMGQQVNVNHTGCEAGEDRKRRLYIKRTEKGLLAYCHHCQQHGFVRETSEARYSAWINKPTTKTTKTKQLPKLGSLSTPAKIWLTTYFCDHNSVDFVGIADEQNKVALCLYNLEGENIGYQIRNLRSDAVPKYITHFFSNSSSQDGAWFYKSTATKLVITEDYLSAYRVHKDIEDASSVALLRTSITDKLIFEINDKGFKQIYVWLDPDAAGKSGAAAVAKSLLYYLPSDVSVTILKHEKEPKECTPTELSTAIR